MEDKRKALKQMFDDLKTKGIIKSPLSYEEFEERDEKKLGTVTEIPNEENKKVGKITNQLSLSS